MADGQTHPLQPVCVNWISKLKKASEYKYKVFGEDAKECMEFFDGPHDWLYGPRRSSGQGMTAGDDDVDAFPEPSFRMSVNKTSEMVQLFGPSLYQKNPQRTITPRDAFVSPVPPQAAQTDPMMQAVYQQMAMQEEQKKVQNLLRAKLLEAFLNYTPTELNLKDHIRDAIDEAIIKGMGVVWHEMVTLPTGVRLPATVYDSVDNLLVDPDGETLEQCKWVARRCTHPVWEVEREYGLVQGSLKGNSESWDSQAESDPSKSRSDHRRDGGTCDLITYWKIYSRMGIGGRLKDADPAHRETLDSFGDFCYLVVADDVPYPLNIPPEVIASATTEEVAQRVQWPAPFWADNAWPFTQIEFHRVPRQPWPMSHLKPGIGELKFLNWAFSFLAGKVRVTARDFIAIMKSANESLKKTIQHAGDVTFIEIDAVHQDINKVVQFLQHPPMNKDLIEVVMLVANEFEKRTGLNELLYGESKKQLRSAAEAEIKNENMSVRPEDMRNKVEDACAEIAKKEALLARWALMPQDVAVVLGPIGAIMWSELLAPVDLKVLVHQLFYRIEADSTRKPNRERAVQNMTEAMKNLFGPLLKYAQETGQVDTINALITDWAKTIDLDASRYLMQPPPPPPEPKPPPPSVSVSLKGEDMIPLGILPGILDDFGIDPKAALAATPPPSATKQPGDSSGQERPAGAAQ